MPPKSSPPIWVCPNPSESIHERIDSKLSRLLALLSQGAFETRDPVVAYRGNRSREHHLLGRDPIRERRSGRRRHGRGLPARVDGACSDRGESPGYVSLSPLVRSEERRVGK